MQQAAIIIYVIVFLYASIGAIFCALIHGLGYRLVLKVPREEMPGFWKRYLVQILFMLAISIVGYLYFDHVMQQINSGNYSASGSLFPPTKNGIFMGMAVYLIANLIVYAIVCAFFLKMLTKFSFADSLKSLSILLIVIAILYAGVLGYAYSRIPSNLMPAEAQAELESKMPDELKMQADLANAALADIKNNSPEVADSKSLDGIWSLEAAKSLALCGKLADAAEKADCKDKMSKASAASNENDNVVIKGGLMHIESVNCRIEPRDEDGYKFVCASLDDGAIQARISPQPGGELLINFGGYDIVFRNRLAKS